MNLNEGLKRVSAVFFGLLGLVGFFVGIVVFIFSPIERTEAVFVTALSPIVAYLLHITICKVVEWVVDGFK
jgi:hypothetical protein